MKPLSSYIFERVPDLCKPNRFREPNRNDFSNDFRKIVLMFKSGNPVDSAIKTYQLFRDNLPSHKTHEYDECVEALVSMSKINSSGFR